MRTLLLSFFVFRHHRPFLLFFSLFSNFPRENSRSNRRATSERPKVSSNGSKEGGNNWSVDGTGGEKEEDREKR